MKINFSAFFLLFVTTATFAQHSVTINIEELSKPNVLLHTTPYQNVLEHLIVKDSGISYYDLKSGKVPTTAYQIIAKSKIDYPLVDRGYHPFFEGMYAAYADHRPFTLSPDIVWLLICQGFANHVNNNADKLRSILVDFKGKMTLIVRDNRISLDNPDSPWPEVFPMFTSQINAYTGKELAGTLTADFSTTTDISRAASQITMMNAVKAYFDFVVIYIGCGIPKVTLEGTPEDWERVLAKTEALRKYELNWWVDELMPVLKEFVQASKGKKDTEFWKAMFKVHSAGKCGSPTIVDGWIAKFFPYSKTGKRNNPDSLSLGDDLPNEMAKVDLLYEKGDGKGNFNTTPLEMWAGFTGLKQDNETFGLKPEIGWMIRKKDSSSYLPLEKLKQQAASTDFLGGIMIRVKTIPKELMEIGPIHNLTIYFIDDIQIPDELANVKIDNLTLYGKISYAETERIDKLLPNTHVIINGK